MEIKSHKKSQCDEISLPPSGLGDLKITPTEAADSSVSWGRPQDIERQTTIWPQRSISNTDVRRSGVRRVERRTSKQRLYSNDVFHGRSIASDPHHEHIRSDICVRPRSSHRHMHTVSHCSRAAAKRHAFEELPSSCRRLPAQRTRRQDPKHRRSCPYAARC